MSTLARNGNRILFIENTGVRAPGIRDIPRLRKRMKNYFRGIKGIREERDNLYVFSPILLPFPYSWIARRINKFLLLPVLEKWLKVLDFSDPIIWVFLPTGISLDIIDNVNKKLIIYYCIDNLSVSSPLAKKVRFTERKLLKKADLVFTTSKALYDYCSVYSGKVSIFPFGVNIDSFEKASSAESKIPQELSGIKGPIVGYVGGIHKWIDQDLVKKAALKLSDLAFVFIGPLQTDVSLLSGIKNIYFLGHKNHAELPYLIKYFSAGMIPYVISDYTTNVYPTKLNEYLAMAKPVVSTALPEVKMFNQKYGNIVYLSSATEEFCRHIRTALEEDNALLRKRRIEAARDNSWGSRIEQMSGLIEKAVEINRLDKEVEWKETLLALYKRARRKFIRLALIFVLTYFFFFYTPFIWFLAEPLKINQKPQKADSIVVFAGGVGESGKAGQGYEERVQQAVSLYKKGYARNIIFSSGYAFVYKEPALMNTLAVSLGVPQDAIILEEKASNTYENVKFTSRILKNKGWNKILLVSSPYHMLRASLVFKKQSPDINVIYTPIAKSIFYSHERVDSEGRIIWKRINYEQIKSLLHEYAGIFYYWFKQYI